MAAAFAFQAQIERFDHNGDRFMDYSVLNLKRDVSVDKNQWFKVGMYASSSKVAAASAASGHLRC